MKAFPEYGRQIIKFESPLGIQECAAPAGPRFDKTQALIWVRMVSLYRAHEKLERSHTVSKRDTMIMEGKMDVLGNILASTLGNAAFYWVEAAMMFAEEKK